MIQQIEFFLLDKLNFWDFRYFNGFLYSISIFDYHDILAITIFLEFLRKRCKQNQAKETKQTKNKVKRKEVKDSPSEDVLSLPGNGARKS